MLRGSHPHGQGEFWGETDWQDLACLLSQSGFKIENDPGALARCAVPPCFPSCPNTPQPFVLKYKVLLWASKMKGFKCKAEDLGSTWEAPARPGLDEQVSPRHSSLFEIRLENQERNE